jgi:CobQ-like glutamine amidotransferase family enzyme
MNIRVAHLYPPYLNIYADRGNIAVLERRAALRGHTLDVTEVEPGSSVDFEAADLVYVGGGQDREQAMIAPDLAARADAIAAAVDQGTALLAVCGGYQLLGRGYRGRDGTFLPGTGLFPHVTDAGETRMIGDILLDCALEPDRPSISVAGFENHAGRTRLDPGATPLGRVVAGYGNDGESGLEGCLVRHAIGTYLHGPLLPRNPQLADTVLRWALEHRVGGPIDDLPPLPDVHEQHAHAVSASRARSRGGRPA